MYLPNLITVIRVLLVPVVVWLIIHGAHTAAFALFLLAGVSDAIDGFLARHFDWGTELGAYLDPLADKMLLVAIYVTLGLLGHMPAWLVIAVVSRDVLIVGAVILSWMLDRPVEMRPSKVSKANTVGQIILAGAVLAQLGFAPVLEALVTPLTWVVGILTLASAAVYLARWLRHMAYYDALGD
ncbi:CDP-alcohol phosphatidyltransferase family protein [Dichotomicrobium thermohalophilum]|uniref:CDP-diacylglycerol--glycerol-3-phosphate 3-phosphatidyltransferase n=1 Tax=Dichotomicrobium thermohalophilum TaxID=933063 RepID=A0A397Q6E6_9HYPH|nr:CDP-alcohol phosphatidyltransferase family protein [Dichotomicrobium thermohalophilum]RIA56836.1 cardiolipin synthase [Dichotomicrobium thermohalophilum]